MEFFLKSTTNIVFATLAVITGSLLLWQGLSRRNVSRVSVTQASIMISSRAQILDVREAEAFADGHIKHAKSLPSRQIAEQLSLLKLKKDKPVLVVCERGTISAKAAEALMKNGFTDIHVLDHGLRAWRDAQLPLVKD